MAIFVKLESCFGYRTFLTNPKLPKSITRHYENPGQIPSCRYRDYRTSSS